MKRCVALVGVVVVTAYVGLVFTAMPASAANLGSAPDTNGNYAVCNVNYFKVGTGGSASAHARVKCNYGEVSGQEAVSVDLHDTTGFWNQYANSGQGTTTCNSVTEPATTITAGTNRIEGGNCFGWGVPAFTIDDCRVNINSAQRACVIETLNTVQADPDDYPTDYYTGGAPGGLSDPPAPTGSCHRMLSSPESGHAEFEVDIDNPDPGYEDEWDWDFGDSTSSGPTSSNPSIHNYDVDTQPDNGWTAEVTITRTGDGLNYDVGPTVDTCELRVDFFNPDADQAGSTGGNGASYDFGACAPSGWGFLNPLAYVEGMGCVLQLLFIPQTFGDNIEELRDAWSDSIGGTVMDGATVLFDFPLVLREQYDESASPCEGPTVNLDFNVAGMAVQEAHPLDACEDPAAQAAETFRFLTTVVLLVAIAFVLVRLALSALGVQWGGSSGDDT